MSTGIPSDRDDDRISQAEAARRLGVSRQAISKMVRTGRLQSFVIGGHVLVSRAEVLTLDRAAGPTRRTPPDEVAEFIAAFDRLPEAARRAILGRLGDREPPHPLETRLGASWRVILDALDRSGPMMIRGLRGVMAEAAFGVQVVGPLLAAGWGSLPVPGDPPYEFLLDEGRGPIRVQVKLQRSMEGRPMLANQASRHYSAQMYVVESQRTRGGKARGEGTRSYRFGEFDLLAVSMQPAMGDWGHFRYTIADWLVPRAADRTQLAKFQPVAPDPNEDWTDDLTRAVQWFRSEVGKTIAIGSGEEGRADESG